jgi:hypothetical protein
MFTVIFFILIGFLVFHLIQRNPGGLFSLDKRDRDSGPTQAAPRKVTAPDDDVEFLAWLDRRIRRDRDQGDGPQA